jgi:monoamine oxidase
MSKNIIIGAGIAGDSAAIFFTYIDSSSIPVFFNLHHYIDQPILIGLSGGDRSRCIENLSDSEIIKNTMGNFKKQFGTELSDPESCINTRWSQDIYSFGSFSYIPTGASIKDFDAIAESVSDKLFFAGEATSSKYPATTHGAYLSGIREANKIIDLYSLIK